jgi:hypothetical protein
MKSSTQLANACDKLIGYHCCWDIGCKSEYKPLAQEMVPLFQPRTR